MYTLFDVWVGIVGGGMVGFSIGVWTLQYCMQRKWKQFNKEHNE